MATWLEQVNAYRALANLAEVTEDPALSKADADLARYEVENLSQVSHLDDKPDNPNYRAAQSSNLAGGADPNASDIGAINQWGTSVFHGLGIIDPHLTKVGFGSYRTTDPARLASAASPSTSSSQTRQHPLPGPLPRRSRGHR